MFVVYYVSLVKLAILATFAIFAMFAIFAALTVKDALDTVSRRDAAGAPHFRNEEFGSNKCLLLSIDNAKKNSF